MSSLLRLPDEVLVMIGDLSPTLSHVGQRMWGLLQKRHLAHRVLLKRLPEWVEWCKQQVTTADLIILLPAAPTTPQQTYDYLKRLTDCVKLHTLSVVFEGDFCRLPFSRGDTAVASAEALALLRKSPRLQNLSLDLSGYGVGDDVAEALATLRYSTTLGSLRLVLGRPHNCPHNTHHDRVTDTGAAHLATLQNGCRLHTLHMDLHNHDIGVGGAQALATLLGEAPGLKSLHLDLSLNKGINDAGARALAVALCEAPMLRTLHMNLSVTQITDAAAQELAAALKKLESLHLKLAGNYMTITGVKALAEALKKAPKLHTLYANFGGNTVGNDGAKALAKALIKAPMLNTLRLGLKGSAITYDGAQALRRLESKFKMNVDLEGNWICLDTHTRPAKRPRIQQT